MTGQHFTGTPATEGQGDAHFRGALIQATLGANRVAGLVSLLWDGPQLWAYAVALGLGEQPERVEKLAGALALAAGADTCRVARAGGRLLLEVPKPAEQRKPLRAARLDDLTAPSPLSIPLGITTGGAVAWLDVADERNAHIVIGGTTGSGKSVCLRWLLYRLLRQNAPGDLRLLAFDPKRGELELFGAVPHLLHPIVSTPLETARALAWVGGELDRRADTGETAPRLLVIVEEVADLIATTPDIAPLMGRIAQIGRGLGVHLIVTTQQPGARSLGAALANFPARILGRVASGTLTYGAAGRGRTMADALLGRGDMLLICGADVTRLQVPLASGLQWGKLPRGGPGSLADELPAVALFADRAGRDPRGGYGRRDLAPADYDRMGQALEAGANVDELRREFGIGSTRARRILSEYRGPE